MMNKNNWTGFVVVMMACLLMACSAHADVKVTSIELKPHWPWNGLVDIVYSVTCDEKDLDGQPFEVRAEFEGYDAVLDKKIILKSLTGDGVGTPVKLDGLNKATWDAAKDYPTINTAAFQVKIHASVPLYMVVDLSGGSKATSYPVRYTGQDPDLTNDICRTTELWLRRIPAGKFLMGSPNEELGRKSDETLHEVTLTKAFYIGVFECTQRQYELVMGSDPSDFKGSARPVEQVSYFVIRGESTVATWPTDGYKVADASFMGKLRARTTLTFDLPTEAQWEYACRAGTTTALNSGKNLLTVKDSESDSNVAEVGRYYYNSGTGANRHIKVGSFMPNVWGLYDMHGNVWEICLDLYGAYGAAASTDPIGSTTGSANVIRGGSYNYTGKNCRSAVRLPLNAGSWRNDVGFRVVFLP